MRYRLFLYSVFWLSTANADTGVEISLSPGEPLEFGGREGMPANYFDRQAIDRSSLVKLVNEIFKPLDIKVKYEELPRRRLIHNALKGDISVFTLPVLDNPIVNIQIPEGVVVGQEALFSYPLNFYTLKKRQLRLDSPEDIAEYSLGLIKEAKFIDQAIKNVVDRELSLVTFHHPSQILKALLAGRVDIIMLAEPIFMFEYGKLNPDEEITLSYSIGRSGRYLAFSEARLGRLNAKSLEAFTNKRLQHLKRIGALQTIEKDYLNAHYSSADD